MFTAGSQLFVHVKVKAKWSSSPGCWTLVLHITENCLKQLHIFGRCVATYHFRILC